MKTEMIRIPMIFSFMMYYLIHVLFQMQDFLESEFLNEQVDSIRELSGWLTVLRRLQNDPLGLHQFDEEPFHGKR